MDNSDAYDWDAYDSRVTQRPSITFRRNPQLAHDLLTGPCHYAKTEQEAWTEAAKNYVHQHRNGIDPLTLVLRLTRMAAECQGDLTVAIEDGGELRIAADDLDDELRIGIRGGRPTTVDEPADAPDEP